MVERQVSKSGHLHGIGCGMQQPMPFDFGLLDMDCAQVLMKAIDPADGGLFASSS